MKTLILSVALVAASFGTTNAYTITAVSTWNAPTTDLGEAVNHRACKVHFWISQGAPVNKSWYVGWKVAYSDALSVTAPSQSTSAMAGFDDNLGYTVVCLVSPYSRNTWKISDPCSRWQLPASWSGTKPFSSGTQSPVIQLPDPPDCVYQGYWCGEYVPQPRHYLWTREPDLLVLVA